MKEKLKLNSSSLVGHLVISTIGVSGISAISQKGKLYKL